MSHPILEINGPLKRSRDGWRAQLQSGKLLNSAILDAYRLSRNYESFRLSSGVEKLCEYILFLENKMKEKSGPLDKLVVNFSDGTQQILEHLFLRSDEGNGVYAKIIFVSGSYAVVADPDNDGREILISTKDMSVRSEQGRVRSMAFYSKEHALAFFTAKDRLVQLERMDLRKCSTEQLTAVVDSLEACASEVCSNCVFEDFKDWV